MNVSEFIRSVLVALLKKADKSPDKSVRISATEKPMKPYIDNDPIGLLAATNDELQRFGDKGLITIKWRNIGILIQYIELINADMLADELGYIRLEKRVSSAYALVESSLTKSSSFEQLRFSLLEKWNLTGTYEGVSIEDPIVLIDAIKAADEIIAMQSGMAGEIDERHFSNRVFLDSKRLKSIRGKVAKILKLTQPDIPSELSPEEVLQLFGVVPLKHPVCVSGPVSIEAINGKTVTADFPPCIGVWADSVKQLHLESPVTVITTIENQATFMRYVVQEKQPDELVIYTAGIPSPALLKFYYLVINMAPHVTLRHWGDIDVGGFIILNILEKNAGKVVEAYRMSPDSYLKKTSKTLLSELEKRQLNKMSVTVSPENKNIVIKAAEVGKKFEQEGFY